MDGGPGQCSWRKKYHVPQEHGHDIDGKKALSIFPEWGLITGFYPAQIHMGFRFGVAQMEETHG